MRILNIVWWFLFLISGILIQAFVPGVDALVPGVIISLHEKRWQQTFWLCLIFTLIQEGTGSLVFGAAPLWYLSVVLVFILGHRLFNTNNFFFIILLGAILACIRFLIVLLIIQVSYYDKDYTMFLKDAVLQTIVFSLVWILANYMRKIMPKPKAKN